MLRIIAVGKGHEAWVEQGVRRYEKRLKKPWDVRWDLVAHSSLEGARARQDESERLLSRIKPTDYVILLDETGEYFDSPGFSKHIQDKMTIGKQIVLIIGGAYGVTESLRDHADCVMSLSPLVFPHQLVRLILIEQLYRTYQIANSHPYHHN